MLTSTFSGRISPAGGAGSPAYGRTPQQFGAAQDLSANERPPSQILVVNLWEHQIGLYQGANMGFLRTVFEVNLGLFGKRTLEG
jgi:hypothetical protein